MLIARDKPPVGASPTRSSNIAGLTSGPGQEPHKLPFIGSNPMPATSMPNKSCPECKEEVHVRTSKCECGHLFYTPTRKTKEEMEPKEEEIKEVKKVPSPPIVKKIVKDPADTLKEEAEDLKYILKTCKTKSKDIHQRFTIHKTINNIKYNGNFNEHGKIIGVGQD